MKKVIINIFFIIIKIMEKKKSIDNNILKSNIL